MASLSALDFEDRFISPDGVEGFNFEGGIDEGDLSPTKKTRIKRGSTTPPRHKLPILFF